MVPYLQQLHNTCWEATTSMSVMEMDEEVERCCVFITSTCNHGGHVEDENKGDEGGREGLITYNYHC